VFGSIVKEARFKFEDANKVEFGSTCFNFPTMENGKERGRILPRCAYKVKVYYTQSTQYHKIEIFIYGLKVLI